MPTGRPENGPQAYKKKNPLAAGRRSDFTEGGRVGSIVASRSKIRESAIATTVRHLLQVQIEDAIEADKVFTLRTGNLHI